MLNYFINQAPVKQFYQRTLSIDRYRNSDILVGGRKLRIVTEVDNGNAAVIEENSLYPCMAARIVKGIGIIRTAGFGSV